LECEVELAGYATMRGVREKGRGTYTNRAVLTCGGKATGRVKVDTKDGNLVVPGNHGNLYLH